MAEIYRVEKQTHRDQKPLFTLFTSSGGFGRIIDCNDKKDGERERGSWITKSPHQSAVNTQHVDRPPESPGCPKDQDPLSKK